MQEHADEKLIEAPHEEMLPKPELEIPAHLSPDAAPMTPSINPTKSSSHSNTGLMIIVALLLLNVILGVYVIFKYLSAFSGS